MVQVGGAIAMERIEHIDTAANISNLNNLWRPNNTTVAVASTAVATTNENTREIATGELYVDKRVIPLTC